MALQNLTIDSYKSPSEEQVQAAVGSLEETVEGLEREYLDYTRYGAVILGESGSYAAAQALGILIGTRHTTDAFSGESNLHLFSTIGGFEANVLLKPEIEVDRNDPEAHDKARVKRAGIFLQDNHRKMRIDNAVPPRSYTLEGGSLPYYGGTRGTRLTGGRQFGSYEDAPVQGPYELNMLRISTSQIIQDVLAAY